MCQRTVNNKNFVRIEDNQIVFFCSPRCLKLYLQRRFAEEGKVFAGKIDEE
jgi:ribosomal protein L24E